MRPINRDVSERQTSSPKKRPEGPKGRSSNGAGEQRALRDYLLMIRERWVLGLFAAIMIVGSLLFFTLRQPRVYEAQASLLFESTNPQVVDIKEVVDTSLPANTADTRLQTHIGQMQSKAFFDFVADTFSDEEIEQIQRPYLTQDENPPSLQAIVRGGISATLTRNTFILTTSARHRDPETAALIANRYATLYIEYNRERTSSGNQSAVAFLEQQQQELLGKMNQSEAALHRYRQQHNLVSLEENQNTILGRLNSLSASVVNARVERLDLDSKLEHVEKYLAEDRPLIEIEYIASYGSVSRLYDELDQLESEHAVLDERYLERHPRIMQINRSLESVRSQIEESIRMAVTELRSRHDRAIDHEQKLKEALAEAEQQSLDLEEIAVQYHVLRRQAAADNEAYAGIVDRLNETRITSQLEEINIRMVDTADAPSLPVEPNLQKLILQSAFLGSFIFLGLPLGLGLLDNKLKAAWEIELLLGLPLVGEVPRIIGLRKRDRPHIITRGQEHSACEAFRGIFSQMQLRSRIESPHTILVTSTLPGEGKSLVASNLSATFAAHGRRTLLVDCDFRRPSLHLYYERKNDRGIKRWVEMEEPEPGTEPLSRTQALGILSLGDKFDLLRTGGESTNPTPMFDQVAFKSLFDDLKTQYDVIMIDTPPVGIFPDSLLLAPLAEEILYVCEFNRVNKIQIQKFVEKIQMTNIDVGGLILNALPAGRTSAYYNYYGYGQVGNREYRAYYSQKR